MTADAKKIAVTENACGSCETPTVLVFHQAFPELRISGNSAEQLAGRLTASVDAVTNPVKRKAVEQAIIDVRAFLDREASHPASDL